MELEELKKALEKESLKDAVLIGLPEERDNYYPAIVEVDEKLGRVTYDYDLLVECFANGFEKKFPEKSWKDIMLDVIDHVDFNVLRSLPYCGEHAPIVRLPEYS